MAKDQEILTLMDILKPCKNGEPVRFVLIDGAPGIGKSTLAWQVCRKWARKELGSAKQYKLVVLIRLREKKAQEACYLEDLPLPCDDTADALTAIGKGERVLIVCDGLDELPYEKRQENSVYINLLKGKLLPEATIIVTSRPSANADLWKHCQHRIDRHLEVIGFTKTDIRLFAESVFKDEILESFWTYITANPPINSMMRIPLNADIIALIYQTHYDASTSFPTTMTRLFDALTRALICRHVPLCQNSDFQMPESLHCIHEIDNLPSQVGKHFLELARIAYKGICEDKCVYTNLAFDFEHLGLMEKIIIADVAQHRKCFYTFLHHTLQEYMAALHIAIELSKCLNSLEFEIERKDVIARFLAGFCDDDHEYKQNLCKWFQHFFGDICFDRSRALQLVHCAYECPSIMQGLKVQYNEEKNAFIVVEPKVGIDWYAMGYCISHFDERWGLHATSLRKENIDLLVQGLGSSPPTSASSGSLQYLQISKSDLPFSQLMTCLEKFCHLQCLELLYVSLNDDDTETLKKLITAKGGPKSLTYQTVNENTHARSLIPMLLEDSSLEELVVRTGSVVNMDTELLPSTNVNLKKLTISCELVQPLAILLPNTSLTHLVVKNQVYHSDLPFLTDLVQSHPKLQVLELGLIVDYNRNPLAPEYKQLTSDSTDLQQLVEVASSCSKELKLQK